MPAAPDGSHGCRSTQGCGEEASSVKQREGETGLREGVERVLVRGVVVRSIGREKEREFHLLKGVFIERKRRGHLQNQTRYTRYYCLCVVVRSVRGATVLYCLSISIPNGSICTRYYCLYLLDLFFHT